MNSIINIILNNTKMVLSIVATIFGFIVWKDNKNLKARNAELTKENKIKEDIIDKERKVLNVEQSKTPGDITSIKHRMRKNKV